MKCVGRGRASVSCDCRPRHVRDLPSRHEACIAHGMKEYAPGIEPAEPSLVDVPAPSADAAQAVAGAASSAGTDPMRASTATGWAGPVRASVATGPDRFLIQATNEHVAGHIDRTLWARAVAHAGGDNALAKSVYVQSRATALRVTKQCWRIRRRSRRCGG